MGRIWCCHWKTTSCGPFDAVASRYGLKCQHADKIALTKLDVLSIMDQIPVITGYQYKNAVTNVFDPTENLEKYTPVVKNATGVENRYIKLQVI